MSKPLLDHIFSFKGRRNRKSYILFVLAVAVLSAISNIIFIEIAPVLVLIIFIPLTIAQLAVTTQRLRDTDHTGWWVLLGFIPIINLILGLYLLFKKGTEGNNRFGSDPLV